MTPQGAWKARFQAVKKQVRLSNVALNPYPRLGRKEADLHGSSASVEG